MDEDVIRSYFTAAAAFVWELFSRQRAKSFRIKTLTRLLTEGRKWRSTKQLARAIGLTEQATVELLLEIGARHNAKEKDVWMLKK